MKTEVNLRGNAQYEGFCVDLLKDVAALLGFDYAIETVEDGKYGVEDPVTKEWNGIVRDLIQGVILPTRQHAASPSRNPFFLPKQN